MNRIDMKLLVTLLFLLTTCMRSMAQNAGSGMITGNIIEEGTGKAVPEATVNLICLTDASKGQTIATGAGGDFSFNNLSYGIYRLRVSVVGFTTLNIDSIHLRADRAEFSLNDLRLIRKNNEMEAVVVYAEKPLVQSKGGNITFNAAESPLSAGASANELLRNVPLVTTDANGNIMVRGKVPVVLIDDKPVNLNAQQLQDFLDALPGSMIEKIEVMTNPPPAYANEEGGVINIVTRKGKIGIGGRFSMYGGTRGELGTSANLSYRDRRLAVNFSAGEGYNRYSGNGYARRENIYADSTDFLNTTNNYTNKNTRPNGRLSVDYDLDKKNSLNTVWQINRNDFTNRSLIEYTAMDQHGAVYSLSDRTIGNKGDNINPNGNLSFRHRGALPDEQLEITGSYNASVSSGNLNFYQQYLNPDRSFSGADSTQRQSNDSRIHGYDIRVNYDKPLAAGGKTFLSFGAYYNNSNNLVKVTTSALNKLDNSYVVNDLLSSNLDFLQTKTNFRASLRQMIGKGLTVTAGTALSRTLVKFDLYDAGKSTGNTYWNWLPFANINKTWDNQWGVTLVYRRTIRRPGLDEMNPAIDYSDPYNIKFGNPGLTPCLTHAFDLFVGKSTSKYYFNYSLSLNKLQDIFNSITTLETNGTTQTTYQNISNRTEYSTGTWSGYTFTHDLRANFGASFTYSQYGLYDRIVNKYQDNGSFYSNINVSYTPAKVWNFSIACLYNRYGNPQGISTGTMTMNMGIQRKFFNKRFIMTLNITDPFVQQSSTAHTNGTNFDLQTYSTTQTRNYRLTLSYDLNRTIDRGRKLLLKAAQKPYN
jgi:outer membrane beta-barrel protein/carboxypeptidase family protein